MLGPAGRGEQANSGTREAAIYLMLLMLLMLLVLLVLLVLVSAPDQG